MPAPAFADRVVELDRLVRDLAAAQKVFLISPRRYGKSSLIRLALAAMARRGLVTVDVTVSSFSSYVSFLEGYARALAAADSRAGRARGPAASPLDFARAGPEPRRTASRMPWGLSWLREAIASTRVDIGPDIPPSGAESPPSARVPGQGPRVAFPNARTDREVARLAEEVFALPARLAEARRRTVVVALDEFQAIAAFDGGSVEHALRAAVQRQREVGYVFAGSEPSLMERMLGPRRPFYKAGPVMRLDKIPAEEFASFVDSRFSRSGVKPEPGLGAAIVDLAGNLPYDVQRLAHETWDEVRARGRRRATLEDLHQALRRLLMEQQTMFEAVWQRLTLSQRAVLRAVVLEQGTELLSADVRTRHRLGGASTVQAALAALVRDDVIAREADGYVVIDSLLREWVARRTY